MPAQLGVSEGRKFARKDNIMKRNPLQERFLGMWFQKAIQSGLLISISFTLGLPAAARAQNPATEWNAIAITAASNGNQNISPGSNMPGGSGIYMAYVHLAIFNAVNAIDRRYHSYGPDIPAPAGAAPDAAAIAAAYRTLVYYFPDQAALLNAQYLASLAAISDSPAKDDGIQVGQAAADGIIAMRSNDGRGANVPYLYPSMPTPGVWIPTPPAFLSPQTPWIGQMQPFSMTTASQFLPDEPPPDLSSQQKFWEQSTASLGHPSKRRLACFGPTTQVASTHALIER